MLNRDRVLNWWTGRVTDQELAEWTGMAPRAVAIVLNLPHMRSGVTGGGRGSRHTRRVEPHTRNAVAIVHALSEAGLTLELATNIIGATPVIASTPTEIVDYRSSMLGVRSLLMVDPRGNWLPTDVVPAHVWENFVIPCAPVDVLRPTGRDIVEISCDEFSLNTERGTIFLSGFGPEGGTELRPLTDRPTYSGEVDLLGWYIYENWEAEAHPRFEEHILIVNGRWVFIKQPDPSPREALQNLIAGRQDRNAPLRFHFDPVSVIEPDKKTVRVIGWGHDEYEQERARHHLKNFDSLLDVNITLAVRKMKRRAYDLPVSKPSLPMSLGDRIRVAQRCAPPVSIASPTVKLDDAAALRKIEEESLRMWITDPDGNPVRVGLTREENTELEEIDKRKRQHDTDDSAFPWASVEEMQRENKRWLELHDKNRIACLKRDLDEARTKRS